MRNKHTKELLAPAVAQSKSWSDVCRILGIKAATGSQTHLKKRAVEFGLDASHFTGKSHNKGKVFDKKDALSYCFKGSKENSHRIRNRLIRDGYKQAVCEICGLNEWRGLPIPLELDHMDGDHSNNEFDNLQVVCPNCHAIETKTRLAK